MSESRTRLAHNIHRLIETRNSPQGVIKKTSLFLNNPQILCDDTDKHTKEEILVTFLCKGFEANPAPGRGRPKNTKPFPGENIGSFPTTRAPATLFSSGAYPAALRTSFITFSLPNDAAFIPLFTSLPSSSSLTLLIPPAHFLSLENFCV